MEDNTDIKQLENFILNNPELDKLEDMLTIFNVFETLNIVNAEIRHSNVLAWLLSPQSNHGLGESFIKQLLKYFVSENKEFIKNFGLSLFDFEIFDYNDIEIRREWKNIDILLLLKETSKNVAVVIENKVTTDEHSNQLQRYKSIIDEEFPDYIKLFIFLTPEETIPSDDSWVNFNYGTIAKLIDELLDKKKDSISENVYHFVKQYNTVLRRYIVGNSEIEQICRQIYKKHAKALDLIFQYKPDLDWEISQLIQELLNKEKGIIIDGAGKTVIRFTTPVLDEKLEKISEGWSNSKRICMFEFNNSDRRLTLRLYIGPGRKDYRVKLHEFCMKEPKLFNLASRQLGSKWLAVYQKEFLRKKNIEDLTFEEIAPVIEKHWDDFRKNDLVDINDYFSQNWK